MRMQRVPINAIHIEDQSVASLGGLKRLRINLNKSIVFGINMSQSNLQVGFDAWMYSLFLAFNVPRISTSLASRIEKMQGDFLWSRPRKGDPRFDAWDEQDSMIMTWLWNSMMPEISDTCMFLTTAKDIWDAVHQAYSKALDAWLWFPTWKVIRRQTLLIIKGLIDQGFQIVIIGITYGALIANRQNIHGRNVGNSMASHPHLAESGVTMEGSRRIMGKYTCLLFN
ncbi:hypothetical protein CK203_036786 [Vitis vinifera]|uniref:Uncharacterized protein n=1 Tax=Vitis vinifera TaxID=29760 RepID=A0A438I0I3_VITVI|nr:hypothetical protein CK203_036786 [Vitis vinifera]